ncbi:MAG TPA: hypothetical protein VKD23_19065 [Terriglobales bacterium]|nr:hypothetical protein [Terriglobales bacterium]
MTVPAVDAIVAHVVLVAELDGLLAGNILVRQVGSAGQTHHAAKARAASSAPKKTLNLEMKFVLR